MINAIFLILLLNEQILLHLCTKCLIIKYIKDLGVIFTSNMSFNKHICNVTAKSFQMLGFVRRTMKPFKDLSVLRSLYYSLIRSKLEYCPLVWSPRAKSMCDQIERVQNKF